MALHVVMFDVGAPGTIYMAAWYPGGSVEARDRQHRRLTKLSTAALCISGSTSVWADTAPGLEDEEDMRR